MGRKKIVDSGSIVLQIDLSKYEIIEQKIPFDPILVCMYGGKLDECIIEFEKKYKYIDGKIYWDSSASLVGFTGTNVMPHEERIKRELNEEFS